VRLDRVRRDIGYLRRNAQGFLHQQGGLVRAGSARGSYVAPGSTYIFFHKSHLNTRQEEVCVSQDICNSSILYKATNQYCTVGACCEC
jgi:hypothetical protein